MTEERDPSYLAPYILNTGLDWKEPQAAELALIIAKARYGPGIDMGGRHNPKPSEVKAARQFMEAIDFILQERLRSHQMASPICPGSACVEDVLGIG